MTCGEIDVPRIAAERAAQQRQRLVLRHAAAGLVGQRDHAVDIGKVGQRIIAGERILLEDVGDDAGDMGAAIHRGEDADIVARRDAAVRAADALEGRGQIEVRRRLDVDAIGIVLGEIAHAAVLRVHVLARRDRHRRKADDLAIAPDRLAHGDRLDRDLVAGGNALDRGDAVGHHRARRQARARDQHAVVGMQADDGAEGHGRSPWLSYFTSPVQERSKSRSECRVRGVRAQSCFVRLRGPSTPALSPHERGEGR